jgi:uncharacterized membrane protein
VRALPLPLLPAAAALAAALATRGPAGAQEGHPTVAAGAGAHGLHGWLEWTTRAIEVAGIGVIVLGGALATVLFLWRSLRGVGGPRRGAYETYRADLGRAILLGLEFLVAADIIGTVALEPTLQSLAVLAGIVLIRTFLSFSLEVEIEGRWPWQQAAARRLDAPRAGSHDRPNEQGEGAAR